MPEDTKFEEAINRLQEIVDKLENGKLDIEESLKYYEEGIKLSKLCSEKLEKVENKITELQTNKQEEITEE
ncbi:MAG: exodeoxyribonuclease VII small subunit [Candidatus Cloacimonetes bacterium]|nr:exodeoxyribonuclease VII small subunit [Candidatus Cloacimonadota bacterium]MBS3767696.1 exodeoxyribonuclease VII small subunit [Candidatus Cloacimonadota bacterium]